jgi:hypothetical protein
LPSRQTADNPEKNVLDLQPGAFAHVYEALGEDPEPSGDVEMTKKSPSISRIPAIDPA